MKNEVFGERFHLGRLRAKLKQQHVAEATGVHVKTVSRWERGIEHPHFVVGCLAGLAIKTNLLHLAGLLDSPIQGAHAVDESELLRLYRRLPPADKSIWLDALRDAARAANLINS